MHKIKRFLRSIFISPLILLVTLYILLEDVIKHFVKPFVKYLSSFHVLQLIEGFLVKRKPYTLLAIYVCKLATFSSIKFFSLYLISQGNIYGGTLLVCGELTGAVITVWYARVALPILLTIEKFAWVYNKLMAIKNKLINNLKETKVYVYAKFITKKIKAIKNARSKSIVKAIYRFLHK